MEIDPGFLERRFREEVRSRQYEQYRAAWKEWPEAGKVGKYPLHIDLEVTNRCNLKCPFCIREADKSMAIGDMDFEMACDVLDQCFQKVPSVKFNWRGEPTLYRKLPQLIRKAKDNDFLETAINTNGTKLDPALFSYLHDMGLDRIIISVDSHTKKNYEEQRIGANYDEVMKNIRDAVAMKNKNCWIRPYIRVQKVDLPSLRHENDDYIKFFHQMGVDSAAINTYKNKDTAKVDWNPLPCAQPYQRIVVGWDGEVYPCCQGHNFPSIGNVKDKSIKELWNGPTMKRLRLVHSKGQQKNIPQCRACETTMPAEAMK